jgi:serine/threonine protein kinase
MLNREVNVMRLCGDHPHVVGFIGAAKDETCCYIVMQVRRSRPHSVSRDDHVITETCCYIVMQLASGGDLEQLLRDGSARLPLARRFELAQRVGEVRTALWQ